MWQRNGDMLDEKRQWLRDFPWPAVCAIHEKLCAEAKLSPRAHDNCPEVEKLWTANYERTMSLREALDLCRHARNQQPFVYLGDSTFNQLVSVVLDGVAQPLPPVEAQILRNTVNHYVAGRATGRELKQVFRSFRKLLGTPSAESAPACASAPQTVAAK